MRPPKRESLRHRHLHGLHRRLQPPKRRRQPGLRREQQPSRRSSSYVASVYSFALKPSPKTILDVGAEDRRHLAKRQPVKSDRAPPGYESARFRLDGNEVLIFAEREADAPAERLGLLFPRRLSL